MDGSAKFISKDRKSAETKEQAAFQRVSALLGKIFADTIKTNLLQALLGTASANEVCTFSLSTLVLAIRCWQVRSLQWLAPTLLRFDAWFKRRDRGSD
jgi:hypothetical protein